jgi:hypothetical protein
MSTLRGHDDHRVGEGSWRGLLGPLSPDSRGEGEGRGEMPRALLMARPSRGRPVMLRALLMATPLTPDPSPRESGERVCVPGTSRTKTGDIEDGFFDDIRTPLGCMNRVPLPSLAGAVGAVGNGGRSAVFQVLWEGAASSRLSIGRQLP